MVMSGGEWIAMDWEQLLIEWVLNCVIVLLPRKPELRIFSPKGYYSNYYPLAFPFRAGLTVKNGGAEGRIYRGLPVTPLFNPVSQCAKRQKICNEILLIPRHVESQIVVISSSPQQKEPWLS
jgi:hypothetical protein